jgi:glycolate oxidase
VTGAEAVLIDGSVIRTGGKLAKDVAGYPLHHLLCGSEGTLAVLTEVTLRLAPLPPHRKTLLAAFASLDRAAAAALEVEKSGFRPSAIELVERAAAALAEEMLGDALPHAGAAALLLVEVEGFREAATQEEAEAVGGILLDAGAEEVDLAPREKVWGVRHAVAEAIKRLPAYSAVDAVVPRRSMPDLIRRAHSIAARHGIEVVCFGHAGDGNIHIDFIRRDAADASWDGAIGPAIRDVLEATVRLGGSITAEHGVGLLRRDDLSLQFDEATIGAMRALKKAWDPKGLLNPGKIWSS